jgi:DNA-binding PadR family transcriptional regulator
MLNTTEMVKLTEMVQIMQITKTEALVLGQLVSAAGSELYGLEMVKASNGALKMGSIYVLLGRLVAKEFVEARKESSDERTVPRRLYKVTGAGRRAYLAWDAAMSAYRQFEEVTA